LSSLLIFSLGKECIAFILKLRATHISNGWNNELRTSCQQLLLGTYIFLLHIFPHSLFQWIIP
jgi:hypothetical protein